MSKSKGNVVDPDALIERFGADTVRLFIIFAAPPEQSLEWSDSGAEGAHRFLKRLWSFGYEQRELIIKENQTLNPLIIDWDKAPTADREQLRQIYEILDLAKFDYERSQLNTVVSGCMKLLNLLTKAPENADPDAHTFIIHKGMSILLRLLAPIAPHITHQLWHDLHYKGVLETAPLPKVNTAALKVDRIELVVQINGKLRTRITIPSDANEETIQTLTLADAKVQQSVSDKTIKKIITVPGRLVNIVTH
jgi:leucyl-tRNA synthetase